MKIDVALVTTRDKKYVKAIAHAESEGLTVTDRKGGVVLQVDAVRRELQPGRYFYGEDVVVESLGGCGCGGMRIEDR